MVVEGQDDGDRAERLAEPRTGTVGCVLVVDGWPAHLGVLFGEAGHGVGEFQRGDAVPLQQRSPPEGGERVGEGAERQRPRRGEVDQVHGGGEGDEIAGALRERLRFRPVGGAVGV
jgi:hypothetical protein